VTKTGSGALTLMVSDSYTGGTTIAGGMLIATNTAALPGWTTTGSISAINAGSTLAVQGGTAAGEFTQANVASVLKDVSFAAGTNLGIQVAGTENFSYSGNIANSASGALGLMKLGGGTLTLSGSNTYSGLTTINAGMLSVAAAGALSPNSSVLISGGALNATSFAANTSSLTVGSSGALDLTLGNLLTASGTANFGGTLDVFGVASGTTELMSYTSHSGTFSNLELNNAATGDTLSYTGSGIYLVVPAASGTGAWASTAASGSWSVGPWSPGSAPNGRGQMAVLNNAPTNSTVSVTLDVPVTIGKLVLGNSDTTATEQTTGFSISAAGSNTLTLDNSGSTAQITVQVGSHVISSPITLAGNLNVAPSAGSTLALDGNITQSGSGSSLTLDDAGTLILGGSNSYTGGTTVNAGTLYVLNTGGLPIDQSLTVGPGAAVAFGPSLAAGGAVFEAPAASGVAQSPEVVPEPGTLALLLAAGTLLLAFRRRLRNGRE
jgi:autotransporter-associated beta strand protein